jgi:branched-chain amino acid transport system permease protein
MISVHHEGKVGLVILLLLLFLPQVTAAFDQAYLVSTATRILIYAIAALSLNLILGYGGLVSFGHSAYLGVGAYVVGILGFHEFEGSTFLGVPGTLNAWVTLPLAVLISALFAFLIGALCLRTRGIYFIMITLAFAQMIFYLFVSLEQYGGDDGLMMMSRNVFSGLDLEDGETYYLLTLIVLGACAWLFRRIVDSRFGRVLQGGKQNELRLTTIGIAPYPYKLAGFVIAGAGAGLAGALLANHMEFVSPDFMHWTRSGDLLIMVILGGIGTWTGPILGTTLFLLLEEFLPVLFHELGWSLLSEHWRIVFGPTLILIVLFARGGLHALLFHEEE